MKQLFLALGILAIVIGIYLDYFKVKPNKIFQSAPTITQRFFGVTISGPEFQEAMYADSNYTGYQYFNTKGLTIIRIPFKWERLQRTLQGSLDADQTEKYATMVTSAQKAGERVIIEPHNFGRYNNNPLTDADQNNFSNLWTRMTEKFKKYPGVWGYELMNEPHDLPGDCQTWATLSQSAIDAIRKEDTKHYILVPGYSWQSAADWQTMSGCLKNLQDPANKLVYSAHEYFDEDKSGAYKSSCSDTNIGVERAQPFLDWLNKNNKIGMFTEYGIPQDTCWQTTLNNFMQTIYTNPNIIGGVYWAAGPYWGDYSLSIEPQGFTDKPQMKILEKYPTTK